MPRVNTDHIFKSTYAIDKSAKEGIDKVIEATALESFTDLLNMVGSNPDTFITLLRPAAARYMELKTTGRAEARKERKAAKLRAELAQLEGTPQ